MSLVTRNNVYAMSIIHNYKAFHFRHHCRYDSPCNCQCCWSKTNHFCVMLGEAHHNYLAKSLLWWLTHCGRVTHICVGELTIIGSDNGLSPERRQAIIWTNAGILLIGPLGTNFSEILIEIQTFSLKKIRLKMSSAKCCPFHLSLNVLMIIYLGCGPIIFRELLR